MADGKLSLPDDLLSSNTKDEAWGGGTGEDKAMMGLQDDSKDQATSDSSIPLSPQWLHAKPVDARSPTSGGSGQEMHTSNSHGKSSDNNLKDSWRLDVSQDKKDWRKVAVDVESSRRWREEERDTSLLGRRDRRKEERRADSMLTRDIADSRSMSSSDRWHDSGSRNSGHESRRDSKWSSTWGPEDKEKDSRTEKRTDVEKEDTNIDKQPFATGSRTTSEYENDSRDKWRPRHRMEVHAGGIAANRSTQGIGSERGRVERSNVRFSAGRGRSIDKGSMENGILRSTPAIGSVPLDKNLSYCYPRGKLLDIYRMLKTLPSFYAMHNTMNNIIKITQEVAIEPLAFVAPDPEEKAVLGDMWLGKITSSENALGSSSGTSNDGLDEVANEENWSSLVKANEIVESFGKFAIDNSCLGSGAEMSDESMAEKVDAPKGEQKPKTAIGVSSSDSLMPAILEDSKIFQEIGSGNSIVELNRFEDQQVADLAHVEHKKLEDIKSAPFSESSSQLPDDPGSLFDFSSGQQCESSNQFALKSIYKAHPLGSIIPPEELSFCYLDPQGAIQGPYLGMDILTWFEQGYFGTDLPVRLSDAPDGSPFHELSEVMPYLKEKHGSLSVGRLSVTVGGSLEESVPPPDSAINFNGVTAIREDQHFAASRFEAISRVDGQSRASNNSFQLGNQYSDDRKFQNFVSQHEEVLIPVRPVSNSGDPLMRNSVDIQNLVSDPSHHPSLSNELSKTGIYTHQDENVHPFGLLMSELRGNSQLRRAHPSNISSSIIDQDQSTVPFLKSNVAFPNQSPFGAVVDQQHYMETWSDDHSKNTLTKPNVNIGLTDVHQSSHGELEFSDFDLQYLILQNLQKEQLQQQNNSPHPLSHTARLGIEEIPPHLLKLQLQQQQQLELKQKQQRLELQRQWQLEFQQQQRIEEIPSHLLKLQLQQQQQLELKQKQQRLELQQQWQLEFQQQQRQLELQQQQRRLELQQQQRQLELQKHHQLLHQQLHHHRVKLQQQQQLVIEQMLQHQISDLGYRQPQVDTMMDNVLEQVRFRMQLPELQLNPHPSRHLDPALEQIIQANFGLNALREQKTDFLELLQAKYGNVLPSDQFHIQQEPLEAQQLSWALKQQLGMDGERKFSGPWYADEASQLPWNLDTICQPQSLGFNTLEFYQQQQSLSSMEQHFNHLSWKHALKERHQQGSYEPNSVEYERSITLPDVAPEMMDSVSGRPQHPDSAERHLYLQSADQLGSFSSNILSLGKQISDDFYGSQPETMEYLSRKNGQLENSRIGGMQQVHSETHQQSKVSEVAANSSIWASTGGEEDNMKRLVMDLNKKMDLQSIQTSEKDYQYHISSFEPQNAFWAINESCSSNLPFSHIPDQEVALNLPFMQGPQNLNSTSLLQDNLLNAAINGQNGDRLPSRSNSGAVEEQSVLSSMRDSHSSYIDTRSIGKLTYDKDLAELERKGNLRGSKPMIAMGRSGSPVEDKLVEQPEAATDFGRIPIKANSKHASLNNAGGNQGLYIREMGHNISCGEEDSNDSVSSTLTKELDNTSHKRPPLSPPLSSHYGLSDLASASVVKQKSSMSLPHNVSEQGQESGGNIAAASVGETQASGKKEMRFRRTSSYGDATVSDTSFIDVLKRPVYSEGDGANLAVSESLDGGSQAARSGKKKGKKGRQIDPALLGFKVSSNRIMMGEIHHLED